MDAPGNFVMRSEIAGDAEVKHWLRASPDQVDDFLYQLTDAIIFHAEHRLRAHAPGNITELVDVDLPHQYEPGVIAGAAGVEPDISEETFGRGLGSDPADYPFYVEMGTGRFSDDPDASHKPIQTIPGTYPMAWEDPPGNMVFAWEVRGQQAQHYGLHSFEDTVAWVPERIELARREFAAETQVRSAL